MAHVHRDESLLERTRLTLDGAQNRITVVGVVLAVIGFGLSFVLGRGADDGMKHFWFSYLLNFLFWLSLSLGALWFVPLQHLTRSSWSVVMRRLAEIVSGTIPVMGLLAIPLLLNLDSVYSWTDAAHMEHDPLLATRSPFSAPSGSSSAWSPTS